MGILEQFKYNLLKKKGVSYLTVKNYIADISQFIRWYTATYNRQFMPSEVTKEQINTYFKQRTLSKQSRNRHTSSLRTFFSYLENKKLIIVHPLIDQKKHEDPWKLNEFAYYLSIYNASENTIKYYSLDVRQFLRWLKGRMQIQQKRGIVKNVSAPEDRLISDYKLYLSDENKQSFSSVNRKCAAVRRYFSWIHTQNLVLVTLLEQ